ncbi:MAG: hypothetical protein R2726_21850 [Acidimicrobiales bacterium]
MIADERGAQLSALLDGELGPDEEAEVRAWLERTPEAQAELAELAEVRSWLRELPPVDPPFGFYERQLRRGRRDRDRGRGRGRGQGGLGLVAAAAAVVLALVLVVGVTPPAEAMVPPVDRYTARHEAMAASSTPAPSPGSGTTGTTLTSVAPASTPAGSSAAGYERVDDAVLVADEARAPATLGPDLVRKAAWRGPEGVLHVVYTSGPAMVSVYEEPGMVSWERLPDAGRRVQLAQAPAWWMRSGPTEIVVVEKQGTVFTVVAALPHDEVIAVADRLPMPSTPTFTERLQRAAEDCARRFGLGD